MILTHVNTKGGVGKTTLNILTAKVLSESGYKTLLVDLDANLSASEVYGKEFADRTAKDLLLGNYVEPYNVRKNLDIIPCCIEMAYNSNVADLCLRNQLKRHKYVENYEFIIIDPPGSWCAQSRNAIYAADKIVVPSTMSKLDFAATAKFFQELANCCVESDVLIVCNKSNKQLNAPGVETKYAEEFGDFLYAEQISDIKTLKRIISDPDYPMHPSIAGKLKGYVAYITGANIGGVNA